MNILWEEKLATGISQIDDQHKELFKRVNDLIEASRLPGSGERLAELFRFLDEYVREHFTFEEKLQRDVGYPRFAEHKKMHDGFASKLGDLKARYLAGGSSLSLRIEINDFVVNWLVHHIGREDRDIAAHILPRSA